MDALVKFLNQDATVCHGVLGSKLPVIFRYGYKSWMCDVRQRQRYAVCFYSMVHLVLKKPNFLCVYVNKHTINELIFILESTLEKLLYLKMQTL